MPSAFWYSMAIVPKPPTVTRRSARSVAAAAVAACMQSSKVPMRNQWLDNRCIEWLSLPAKHASAHERQGVESSEGRSLAALQEPNLKRQPSVMQQPMDGMLVRSEEHPSELQSLMRISYAVFCLTKTTNNTKTNN